MRAKGRINGDNVMFAQDDTPISVSDVFDYVVSYLLTTKNLINDSKLLKIAKLLHC